MHDSMSVVSSVGIVYDADYLLPIRATDTLLLGYQFYCKMEFISKVWCYKTQRNTTANNKVRTIPHQTLSIYCNILPLVNNSLSWN